MAGYDTSPEIIHVVNYSEAVRLAAPPIVKDSIRITFNALCEYRAARALGKMPNVKYVQDVKCCEEAYITRPRAPLE